MLAVYGAGGFALQILDMVEATLEAGSEICFVDDTPHPDLFGIAIRSLDEISRDASFVIAISDPESRRTVAGKLSRFFNLIAPSASVSRHSRIDEGAILCRNTIIEPGAQIGRHFHANIYSYVAHESRIGDFVTFAPRVNCNGRVEVGDGAYVGTGAFLKQGIKIGRGAIVGMGCVVIEDVPADTMVAGNPARIIDRARVR